MEALTLNAANLERIREAAGEDLPIIAREIQTGQAQFLDCYGCAFVLRAEGSEMVTVCAEGKNLLKAVPLIIQKAKERGYKTIRFHTKRPALQRLLNKINVSAYEAERVYRVVLDG